MSRENRLDQLKILLKPPAFEDENQQRIANIEYWLSLVIFFASSLVAVLAFAFNLRNSAYIAFLIVLIVLGCLWLIRQRHLSIVSFTLPFTIVLATSAVLIIEKQRVHDYVILLYPLAIILSGLFIGRKAPIYFSIFIIFCLTAIYIAEINQWIPKAMFNPTYLRDVIFVSIFMLMTGFLVDVAIKIINENLVELQGLNLRLRQNEANYRLLFEETPDIVIITDENGFISLVNPGALALLGYSKEEMIGKQPQDFIAPEDLERQAATQLAKLRQGHTFRHERILVCKDGSGLSTYTSFKALPDGRFQFLATDISERIAAEQAMRDLTLELEQRVQRRTAELAASNTKLAVELAERQKFEESLSVTLAHTQALYRIAHALIAQDDLPKLLTAIVDNMVKALSADDGLLIIFDLERKKVLQFVRFATGLEDIDQISFEELWNGLSGWTMRELKPALSIKNVPDLRESEKARQIRATDHRGSIIVVPLHYRKKIFGTLTALNRPDQPDFTETDVGMMTAIANQAAIAIENASLFEQLQQHAQELEVTNKELESFAYSVSHDLRSPLRAITGYCEIIAEDFAEGLGKEGQEYLTRVMQSSRRMNELIESLLTFSRLARAEINQVEIDLSAIAQNILSELKTNEPARSVNMIIKPEIIAWGDYDLIQTVIVNLLENAWKYSAKTEQTQIEFGCQAAGNETVYFVRDNGAGFDMHFADKLFTPFQRLHNPSEFPGHGIGLANAQRIIHRHGGRIWAEAELGKGAIFYFTLAPRL